jgi:CPA2 family monovalent cation:H+ antiporter-2
VAASIDATLFKETLVVLGATAAVVPIFHRLKVSPVIGFILIGMLLGPYGLGALNDVAPWLRYATINDAQSLAPVAEWGVVLLLFMIGLELSFDRLRVMARLVFGLGALQVALCTLGLAAALIAWGVPTTAALLIGVALAQSSTTVLVQVLAEEKKLSTPVGRTSLAVLLFQDIAVAPILFGVAVLGAAQAPSLPAFAAAIVQAGLAVALLVGAGRLALRPLFRSVARTQSPELFLAACLLVIIGAALGASAAGLSAAMGALAAGLLLAETEYRRQIEVLIEPFKGLFLGVFLISAGMSIDLHAALAEAGIVAAGALGLIAIKASFVYALARLFAFNVQTALGAALLLAPGGEFAFVILGAADGLLDPAIQQAAMTVAALTMLSVPLLSRLGDQLGRRLRRQPEIGPTFPPPENLDVARVVIAGFGRVGRLVGDMLEEHKLSYIALDTSPDVVAAARRAGKPVYFGDASNPLMLERCGLPTMRALVVTMDDPERVEEVIAVARRARADLLIVARARDAQHAARLYKLGASDVAPETIEASLQLSEAVLVDLGVPMGPVIASIHDKRAQFRADVLRLAPGVEITARPRLRLKDMLGKPDRAPAGDDRRD